MNHRHAEQIPLVVLGTYAVGYLAGRSIGALWLRQHPFGPVAPVAPVAEITGDAAGAVRSRTRAA